MEIFVGALEKRIARELEKRGKAPEIDLPEQISLADLRARPLSELLEDAKKMGLKTFSAERRKLVFDMATKMHSFGVDIFVEGIVDRGKESYALVRDLGNSFKAGPDDVYLSAQLVKEFALETGHLVKAKIRAPKGRDTYLSAQEIVSIEDVPVAEFDVGISFEDLLSEFPSERFHLELDSSEDFGGRIVDLVAPLGQGQRGLIVAPPRGGKDRFAKANCEGDSKKSSLMRSLLFYC